MITDRTNSMVAKQQRDTAYNDACAEFDEAPTCTRILNHPDPCNWCWAGGLNKDFQVRAQCISPSFVVQINLTRNTM